MATRGATSIYGMGLFVSCRSHGSGTAGLVICEPRCRADATSWFQAGRRYRAFRLSRRLRLEGLSERINWPAMACGPVFINNKRPWSVHFVFPPRGRSALFSPFEFREAPAIILRFANQKVPRYRIISVDVDACSIGHDAALVFCELKWQPRRWNSTCQNLANKRVIRAF